MSRLIIPPHLLLIVFSIVTCALTSDKCYVPNEETAIRIAEAIWLPLYGKDIYSKKPFEANLQGDTVWHVYGTLPPLKKTIRNGDTTITITFGGVPHAYIRKTNGCIIRVYHSK